MNNKLTIIIPVYNIEKYIRRCLESILNQEYKSLEIICINDGSTDNSLNILQEYQSKDKRIKVINKVNEGASAARNDGIKIATGKYMMFVDGDDWIDPEMIVTLIKEIEDNDADIVKCFYLRDYLYKQEIESMNLGTEKLIVSEEQKSEKIYPLFINGYVLNSMWGQVIKSNIIKENNIRIKSNYIYGEDTRFNYDLYTYAKKIVLLDKPYYHYFFNDNSVTTVRSIEKITKRLNDIINVHNELYDFAKLWNISSPKVESSIANRIIREFTKRSREFFMLIDQNVSRKEIKKNLESLLSIDIVKESIKINGGNKINGLDKECEIYSKIILKQEARLFTTVGIGIYKVKKIIKKLKKWGSHERDYLQN